MPMIVKNNTPSAGYIQWTDVSISYKGQTYKIANGSTSFIYVYWKLSDPTSFYGSNAFPSLGDDDLLVFLNKNGTHVKVPTASVVDGSLIVPESIITDALAANVVTSEKIRSDAIEARHIKAGEITTDLLASGVNPNIVMNGYDTFAQLPTGTGNVARTAGTSLSIVDYANGLTSGKVLQAQSATGYLAKDVNDFSIPVTPGQKLIVSAYVRNDSVNTKNNQTLGLRFNNSAKDIFGAAVGVMGNSGWIRIMVAVTVPAGATKAMLYVQSVSNYFWDAFMVETAEPNQTEASAWKPSGTTVIWGGNIATRSLKADRLESKSITANELAANIIEANHIKSLNGLNVNNQFIVDANGNVRFAGNLDGASGTFTGDLEGSTITGGNFYSSTGVNGVTGASSTGWFSQGEISLERRGANTILEAYTYITPESIETGSLQTQNLTVLNAKPYHDLVLLNGWEHFGGGYQGGSYTKDITGHVQLRGLVRRGALGSVVANLPAGYRPKETLVFLCGTYNGYARVDVLPNGNVIWAYYGEGNTWLTLNSIRFLSA